MNSVTALMTSHNTEGPPLQSVGDESGIEKRSFISVASAVSKGEIFYTDNGTGVSLIKGRTAR
jgi:hypothetical protein